MVRRFTLTIAESEIECKKPITEISNLLVQHFNLNPNRSLKSLFKKEAFEYQGTLSGTNFTISKNNALRSINDGLYFFFTKISGSMTSDTDATNLKINARPNEAIEGMLYLAPIIVLFQILLKSYGSAVFSTAIIIGACIYAKKKIKEDFEMFSKRLHQVISINH